MMKGYCVFWIPSIYHVAPVPLSENSFLEKEDISDEVGCQCHLSLKLDSQENIIVILSLHGIDEEFSLMHKGSNDNGFILYSFDVSVADTELLIKALTNPIYHYVKGFYHEHKNHTDDCDSILDAYVCTEESDSQISSPDNKPLIFYLRQYEKRFRDFTEQLEFDASYLMSILDSPDYRDVLYKEKFESFDARCIDILGEVVYYRALLYSHNNVSYHKALGDNHTLQACAFNTDNAINNIKVIKERVENVFQGRRANATLVHIKMANDMLVAGDKISKLSVRLGWLGAILGVLSLLLGIISIL